MDKYNHAEIEAKWQKIWEDEGIYRPDIKNAKRPFYNLMMFPYPSAEGLHVGNMYAFTAADVYGRFKRLQGFDVFEPIGLDGFGIHSENYALKVGRHPKEHAAITEKNFYRQLHTLGNMYDWSRTVETYSPEYYKWTQWIFVQMFKNGLAYRATSNVNWCSKCKTVLADEQVIAGKCERCNTETEKKNLEQWFFKITAYSEALLVGHAEIDWSDNVITAQRNWIGKSEGYLINFKTDFDTEIVVFTTRPDTLNSVTFIALAVDHPLVLKKIDEQKRREIGISKDKLGMDTGWKAINPLTGKPVPVWVANYVSGEYGTGAVMGVPGYDERDREFAQKYHLDIVEESLTEAVRGIKTTKYHLRDWLISRQRYWGPPIPMINCSKCSWQPVPEDQLPVLLPDIKDFEPEGEGRGPLAKHPEFYKTTCPKCGGEAVRETDVSDTFLDSAWYFLRYPSQGAELPWDPEITKKWLPVDMYTGGPEHANLHLMYVRFLTMALHDMGYLEFKEPMKRFFAHGLIIKDGAKMSKSKGNVVNPDEYIAKYGADALRIYLMFMGPVSHGGDFRDTGMEGINRWINRLWRTIPEHCALSPESCPAEIDHALNKLIKKATENIEARKYNLVIASMMEFVNLVEKTKSILPSSVWKNFLLVLAPFAPHMAEELWHEALHQTTSIHTHAWPTYDLTKTIDQQVTVVVQINGKIKDKLVIESKRAGEQEYIKQLAIESAKVAAILNGASYRTIFVPGKLINFVT